MKTPMQELIDWLKVYDQHQPYLNPREALMKATELLAKEKQEIKKAYLDGHSDCYMKNVRTSTDYYNETYGK